MRAANEHTERIQLLTVPPNERGAITSQDKSITALRETIANYRESLDEIEKKENLAFANRSSDSLKKRIQIISTLETSINRANTLTPKLKNVVAACINEIKTHKPSWSELSLIDKILDIITLGLYSLIRLSTFKEDKSAICLEKISEKYTDNPFSD